MTIAKRLMVLLAVPLLALMGLGVFTRLELGEVEQRSRFLSESRIQALATLGNLSRAHAELQANLSAYVQATNQAQRATARAAFDKAGTEADRLLRFYGDNLLATDKGRRLRSDFQNRLMAWIAAAKEAMAEEDKGAHEEALILLNGALSEQARALSEISSEWIGSNETMAVEAGKNAVAGIEGFKLRMLIANSSAILLTGLLGLVTFWKIVRPIRGLEASVKGIAKGDYEEEVPYTESSDETGGLARSIDVLKQGAAAMDQQRWVKGGASRIMSVLQGAPSLAEFGQGLVSGLVPMLGGGVAGFYLFDGESQAGLKRIAGFGLVEGPDASTEFRKGEGLVGQCAQECKPISLGHLPPGYLRIASGLGESAPVETTAFPLMSKGGLLGVLEVATFRSLGSREKALMEELLPTAAMSLEVLQRNLRTQELLDQTQEQARRLEQQTEELTQSQEELLAQQEQLERSEERSRLILESTAEGMFGTDTEGRITFVNPAACRMLGFGAEELLGQHCHAKFHGHRADGSEYPKEECPMYAAYAQAKASRIENEVLWRKDGSGLPVEYGATPILKDGVVVGSVVSFSDITKRKRAEQELAYRLAFQRALLETIPYPMFVKNSEGRFISCNRAYEREFGTTREFLRGKTVLDMHYLPEAERVRFHKEDLEVIHAAGRRSYELPIQYADGQTHITLYSVDGFKLSDGSAGGLIGLLVDISDQKRIAEELREAKARAEEATQMKSMFLANMSHEIRTPMNAIIGLSHLALRTSLTAKQRDYISKVHNAGTSLLAVINDILDFSKIEAGKLDLETTEFKLDEVIGSVTTLTAQKAHEKGLELLAQVAPEIPEHLLGDPLRLGQILTNLVNNAVKFTERGEIRLSIDLLERTGEKAQLKFTVKDTGIGMSKEQAGKLFQPFTQADMSTTRKHGGTGLGLTICRRLVDLMGGRIWLESEPGVGSTFYFTVWLGVGEGKEGGKRVPEKLTELRVLVVDDNATAREILQEPLSTVVSRVDAVASGKEAITAVQQHDAADPYDIVFMDWRMPGMDGLQASRHIKGDETLRHPPHIVLVTAFGREEVREEAERLQLDGFLVKPVTKSMIVDTLVSVFSQEGDDIRGAAEGEDGGRLVGARILLAEDNEINQQIAKELLEGAGATLVIVNNGREAVDILSHGPLPPPFDVVLMDLQMPEMDGYQATAKLRSEPRLGELPIIAMTAHATVEERQRCLAAGMNGHIAKPIDPRDLFETVGKFYSPASLSEMETNETKGYERQASENEAVPSIAGLDTASGLSRVARNRKLYLKLLRQFIEQQGASASRITEALEHGDACTAERLAHTVKGVAGNLGAGAVQTAAGKVEKAIAAKTSPSELTTLLGELSEVLGDFVERLGAALPAVENVPAEMPGAGEGQVDPSEAKRVVEEMIGLLNNFDPAAGECLEANLDVFRAVLSRESLTEFEQHLNGFAFAEALAQLEPAAKEKGYLSA